MSDLFFGLKITAYVLIEFIFNTFLSVHHDINVRTVFAVNHFVNVFTCNENANVIGASNKFWFFSNAKHAIDVY